MTTCGPVVFDTAPPFESAHPRVTVRDRPWSANRGDGQERTFTIRYVVDGRTEVREHTRHGRAAARRAARLVRERKPFAVWLLDYDRARSVERFDSGAWRPLGRATDDVGAALVARIR
jgi:hypothetical protein